METKLSFASVVDAVIASHKSLYDLLLDAFEYYRPDVVARPPRLKRISRILDCEANGAHKILEDMASAVKAEPRGSLGNYPDLLLAECRDFLYFLDDHINSPDCAAAINDICQKEEAFVNFIKGLSGSDPNISQSEYSIRIDKFIHDLKELFRNLGHALTKFECSLGFRFNTLGETGGSLLQKRRAVRKQPIAAAEDSVKATRRKDTVAAVKEIRRRVKLGESYASAASYLKRNSAWKVRLSHIKAETLVRYAKDRKKTSEIEFVNSSHESAAKEEIKSKSSMPKCGIIRGMRKSTKSAIAITLVIAGAIASPFSSNAAAPDLRGGGQPFSAKRRNRRVRAA